MLKSKIQQCISVINNYSIIAWWLQLLVMIDLEKIKYLNKTSNNTGSATNENASLTFRQTIVIK
jgi:hypothetical protein